MKLSQQNHETDDLVASVASLILHNNETKSTATDNHNTQQHDSNETFDPILRHQKRPSSLTLVTLSLPLVKSMIYLRAIVNAELQKAVEGAHDINTIAINHTENHFSFPHSLQGDNAIYYSKISSPLDELVGSVQFSSVEEYISMITRQSLKGLLTTLDSFLDGILLNYGSLLDKERKGHFTEVLLPSVQQAYPSLYQKLFSNAANLLKGKSIEDVLKYSLSSSSSLDLSLSQKQPSQSQCTALHDSSSCNCKPLIISQSNVLYLPTSILLAVCELWLIPWMFEDGLRFLHKSIVNLLTSDCIRAERSEKGIHKKEGRMSELQNKIKCGGESKQSIDVNGLVKEKVTSFSEKLDEIFECRLLDFINSETGVLISFYHLHNSPPITSLSSRRRFLQAANILDNLTSTASPLFGHVFDKCFWGISKQHEETLDEIGSALSDSINENNLDVNGISNKNYRDTNISQLTPSCSLSSSSLCLSNFVKEDATVAVTETTPAGSLLLSALILGLAVESAVDSICRGHQDDVNKNYNSLVMSIINNECLEDVRFCVRVVASHVHKRLSAIPASVFLTPLSSTTKPSSPLASVVLLLKSCLLMMSLPLFPKDILNAAGLLVASIVCLGAKTKMTKSIQNVSANSTQSSLQAQEVASEVFFAQNTRNLFFTSTKMNFLKSFCVSAAMHSFHNVSPTFTKSIITPQPVSDRAQHYSHLSQTIEGRAGAFIEQLCLLYSSSSFASLFSTQQQQQDLSSSGMQKGETLLTVEINLSNAAASLGSTLTTNGVFALFKGLLSHCSSNANSATARAGSANAVASSFLGCTGNVAWISNMSKNELTMLLPLMEPSLSSSLLPSSDINKYNKSSLLTGEKPLLLTSHSIFYSVILSFALIHCADLLDETSLRVVEDVVNEDIVYHNALLSPFASCCIVPHLGNDHESSGSGNYSCHHQASYRITAGGLGFVSQNTQFLAFQTLDTCVRYLFSVYKYFSTYPDRAQEQSKLPAIAAADFNKNALLSTLTRVPGASSERENDPPYTVQLSNKRTKKELQRNEQLSKGFFVSSSFDSEEKGIPHYQQHNLYSTVVADDEKGQEEIMRRTITGDKGMTHPPTSEEEEVGFFSLASFSSFLVLPDCLNIDALNRRQLIFIVINAITNAFGINSNNSTSQDSSTGKENSCGGGGSSSSASTVLYITYRVLLELSDLMRSFFVTPLSSFINNKDDRIVPEGYESVIETITIEQLPLLLLPPQKHQGSQSRAFLQPLISVENAFMSVLGGGGKRRNDVHNRDGREAASASLYRAGVRATGVKRGKYQTLLALVRRASYEKLFEWLDFHYNPHYCYYKEDEKQQARCFNQNYSACGAIDPFLQFSNDIILTTINAKLSSVAGDLFAFVGNMHWLRTQIISKKKSDRCEKNENAFNNDDHDNPWQKYVVEPLAASLMGVILDAHRRPRFTNCNDRADFLCSGVSLKIDHSSAPIDAVGRANIAAHILVPLIKKNINHYYSIDSNSNAAIEMKGSGASSQNNGKGNTTSDVLTAATAITTTRVVKNRKESTGKKNEKSYDEESTMLVDLLRALSAVENSLQSKSNINADNANRNGQEKLTEDLNGTYHHYDDNHHACDKYSSAYIQAVVDVLYRAKAADISIGNLIAISDKLHGSNNYHNNKYNLNDNERNAQLQKFNPFKRTVTHGLIFSQDNYCFPTNEIGRLNHYCSSQWAPVLLTALSCYDATIRNTALQLLTLTSTPYVIPTFTLLISSSSLKLASMPPIFTAPLVCSSSPITTSHPRPTLSPNFGSKVTVIQSDIMYCFLAYYFHQGGDSTSRNELVAIVKKWLRRLSDSVVSTSVIRATRGLEETGTKRMNTTTRGSGREGGNPAVEDRVYGKIDNESGTGDECPSEEKQKTGITTYQQYVNFALLHVIEIVDLCVEQLQEYTVTNIYMYMNDNDLDDNYNNKQVLSNERRYVALVILEHIYALFVPLLSFNLSKRPADGPYNKFNNNNNKHIASHNDNIASLNSIVTNPTENNLRAFQLSVKQGFSLDDTGKDLLLTFNDDSCYWWRPLAQRFLPLDRLRDPLQLLLSDGWEQCRTAAITLVQRLIEVYGSDEKFGVASVFISTKRDSCQKWDKNKKWESGDGAPCFENSNNETLQAFLDAQVKSLFACTHKEAQRAVTVITFFLTSLNSASQSDVHLNFSLSPHCASSDEGIIMNSQKCGISTSSSSVDVVCIKSGPSLINDILFLVRIICERLMTFCSPPLWQSSLASQLPAHERLLVFPVHGFLDLCGQLLSKLFQWMKSPQKLLSILTVRQFNFVNFANELVVVARLLMQTSTTVALFCSDIVSGENAEEEGDDILQRNQHDSENTGAIKKDDKNQQSRHHQQPRVKVDCRGHIFTENGGEQATGVEVSFSSSSFTSVSMTSLNPSSHVAKLGEDSEALSRIIVNNSWLGVRNAVSVCERLVLELLNYKFPWGAYYATMKTMSKQQNDSTCDEKKKCVNEESKKEVEHEEQVVIFTPALLLNLCTAFVSVLLSTKHNGVIGKTRNGHKAICTALLRCNSTVRSEIIVTSSLRLKNTTSLSSKTSTYLTFKEIPAYLITHYLLTTTTSNSVMSNEQEAANRRILRRAQGLPFALMPILEAEVVAINSNTLPVSSITGKGYPENNTAINRGGCGKSNVAILFPYTMSVLIRLASRIFGLQNYTVNENSHMSEEGKNIKNDEEDTGCLNSWITHAVNAVYILKYVIDNSQFAGLLNNSANNLSNLMESDTEESDDNFKNDNSNINSHETNQNLSSSGNQSLCTSSSLISHGINYLQDCFLISISGLSARNWHVRNSCMMLLASTIVRLVGVTSSSNTNVSYIYDTFETMSQMMELIEECQTKNQKESEKRGQTMQLKKKDKKAKQNNRRLSYEKEELERNKQKCSVQSTTTTVNMERMMDTMEVAISTASAAGVTITYRQLEAKIRQGMAFALYMLKSAVDQNTATSIAKNTISSVNRGGSRENRYHASLFPLLLMISMLSPMSSAGAVEMEQSVAENSLTIPTEWEQIDGLYSPSTESNNYANNERKGNKDLRHMMPPSSTDRLFSFANGSHTLLSDNIMTTSATREAAAPISTLIELLYQCSQSSHYSVRKTSAAALIALLPTNSIAFCVDPRSLMQRYIRTIFGSSSFPQNGNFDDEVMNGREAPQPLHPAADQNAVHGAILHLHYAYIAYVGTINSDPYTCIKTRLQNNNSLSGAGITFHETLMNAFIDGFSLSPEVNNNNNNNNTYATDSKNNFTMNKNGRSSYLFEKLQTKRKWPRIYSPTVCTSFLLLLCDLAASESGRRVQRQHNSSEKMREDPVLQLLQLGLSVALPFLSYAAAKQVAERDRNNAEAQQLLENHPMSRFMCHVADLEHTCDSVALLLVIAVVRCIVSNSYDSIITNFNNNKHNENTAATVILKSSLHTKTQKKLEFVPPVIHSVLLKYYDLLMPRYVSRLVGLFMFYSYHKNLFYTHSSINGDNRHNKDDIIISNNNEKSSRDSYNQDNKYDNYISNNNNIIIKDVRIKQDDTESDAENDNEDDGNPIGCGQNCYLHGAVFNPLIHLYATKRKDDAEVRRKNERQEQIVGGEELFDLKKVTALSSPVSKFLTVIPEVPVYCWNLIQQVISDEEVERRDLVDQDKCDISEDLQKMTQKTSTEKTLLEGHEGVYNSLAAGSAFQFLTVLALAEGTADSKGNYSCQNYNNMNGGTTTSVDVNSGFLLSICKFILQKNNDKNALRDNDIKKGEEVCNNDEDNVFNGFTVQNHTIVNATLKYQALIFVSSLLRITESQQRTAETAMSLTNGFSNFFTSSLLEKEKCLFYTCFLDVLKIFSNSASSSKCRLASLVAIKCAFSSRPQIVAANNNNYNYGDDENVIPSSLIFFHLHLLIILLRLLYDDEERVRAAACQVASSLRVFTCQEKSKNCNDLMTSYATYDDDDDSSFMKIIKGWGIIENTQMMKSSCVLSQPVAADRVGRFFTLLMRYYSNYFCGEKTHDVNETAEMLLKKEKHKKANDIVLCHKPQTTCVDKDDGIIRQFAAEVLLPVGNKIINDDVAVDNNIVNVSRDPYNQDNKHDIYNNNYIISIINNKNDTSNIRNGKQQQHQSNDNNIQRTIANSPSEVRSKNTELFDEEGENIFWEHPVMSRWYWKLFGVKGEKKDSVFKLPCEV